MVDGPSGGTEMDFDAMSPVHSILPDGGLGSHLSVSNYAALARRMYQREKLPTALLQTHARDLSHLAEPRRDALLRSVRSSLLQVLKSLCPDDEVSDVASRLASDEIRRFRTNYPMLSAPKGLRDQIVQNVLHRLELFFPRLRGQTRHRNDATPVLSGEEV